MTNITEINILHINLNKSRAAVKSSLKYALELKVDIIEA